MDTKSQAGPYGSTPMNTDGNGFTFYSEQLTSYGPSSETRIVDLLSMEEFGHNCKIVRKTPSILNAENVEIDEVKGEISTKTDMTFSPVPRQSAIHQTYSVVSLENSFTYFLDMSSPTGGSLQNLKQIYVKNATNYAMYNTCMAYARNNNGNIRVEGIQALAKSGTGFDTSTFSSIVANKSQISTGTSSLIDANGKLKQDFSFSQFAGENIANQFARFRLTLQNGSGEDMKLFAFWVIDTLDENGNFETPRAVTPVVVPNGASGTISQEYGNNFGWFICGAFKAVVNGVDNVVTITENNVSFMGGTVTITDSEGTAYRVSCSCYYDVDMTWAETDRWTLSVLKDSFVKNCSLKVEADTRLSSGYHREDSKAFAFGTVTPFFPAVSPRERMYYSDSIEDFEFSSTTSGVLNPPGSWVRFDLKPINISGNCGVYVAIPFGVKRDFYFPSSTNYFESVLFQYNYMPIVKVNSNIDFIHSLMSNALGGTRKKLGFKVKVGSKYKLFFPDMRHLPNTEDLYPVWFKVLSFEDKFVAITFMSKDGNRYYLTLNRSDSYSGGHLIAADNESVESYPFFCSIYQLTPGNPIGSDTEETVDANNKTFYVVSVRHYDDNIYQNILSPMKITVGENTCFALPSKVGLSRGVLDIRFQNRFVSENMVIPFKWTRCIGLTNSEDAASDFSLLVNFQLDPNNTLDGTGYVNVGFVPAYNSQTKTLALLPDRLSDTYPYMFNDSLIGYDSISFGKSKFCVVNGGLFNSGRSGLCPNETGSLMFGYNDIKFIAGMFFGIRDMATEIYTFNELGKVQLGVIEDRLMCTPVKLQLGALCVCSSSIWVLTDKQTERVYSFTGDIDFADIKTSLDKSAIIITSKNEIVNCYKVGQDLSIVKFGMSSITGVPVVSESIPEIVIYDPDSNNSDLYKVDVSKSGNSGSIESAKLILNLDKDSIVMAREILFYAKTTGSNEIVNVYVNGVGYNVTVNGDYKLYKIELTNPVEFDILTYKFRFNTNTSILTTVRAIVEAI